MEATLKSNVLIISYGPYALTKVYVLYLEADYLGAAHWIKEIGTSMTLLCTSEKSEQFQIVSVLLRLVAARNLSSCEKLRLVTPSLIPLNTWIAFFLL